jgi:hypothetical protein
MGQAGTDGTKKKRCRPAKPQKIDIEATDKF